MYIKKGPANLAIDPYGNGSYRCSEQSFKLVEQRMTLRLSISFVSRGHWTVGPAHPYCDDRDGWSWGWTNNSNI